MPKTKFVPGLQVLTADNQFRNPLAQIGGLKKVKKVKDRQTDTREYMGLKKTITYSQKLKLNPSQHSLKAQHKGSTRGGQQNKGKPNRK